MKLHLYHIRFAIFLLFAVWPSSADAQSPVNEAIGDSWIAEVGGNVISHDAYVRRYSDFIFANGMRDNLAVRKAILENMINEELLLNHDGRGNVDENPDYIAALENARKQTVLAYLKDREIYAAITVNDAELRQAFARANERIEARHLYAGTESEANELYELATGGVDFGTLARHCFSDSTLRNNGGYLGFFTWGDMDPAFEEMAYSLAPGEISPPVKTEFGYSVIKVESRTPHPLLTETQFLLKRAHLERVLKIKKKRESEREYTRQVFNVDDVKFDEEVLREGIEVARRPAHDPERLSNSPSARMPCATYAGKAYTWEEMWARIGRLPALSRKRVKSAETVKSAIKGLILQERLLEIARGKGYDTLTAVQAAFTKTQNALFLKFRLEEITEKAAIAESALHDYYAANIERFSSELEVNAQEIVLGTVEEANAVIGRINAGEDFGILARKYSLREWSARIEGVTGFAPVSRFGTLRDVLTRATIGEVLGPIMVGTSACIFKVLAKREPEPIPFGVVREDVLRSARFEMQRTIVRDYLASLGSRVTIRRNEELLKSFEPGNVAGRSSDGAVAHKGLNTR